MLLYNHYTMEKECRICMINNYESEEVLIQPCRCITSYVHESCLQRWRNENIDNKKYKQCEICKAYYVISRDFPRETFKLLNNGIISCCSSTMYFFLGTLVCVVFDLFLDQISLVVLNGGSENNTLRIALENDGGLYFVIYYTSYTSFIYCLIFFAYIYWGLVYKIHMKQLYIEKTRFQYFVLFTSSFTYFYNYYIFYKAFNSFDLYLWASFITVILNFSIIKSITHIHNKTIDYLDNNYSESIISICYNPLIEITVD